MLKSKIAILVAVAVASVVAAISTGAKATGTTYTYTFAQAVDNGTINAGDYGCVSGTNCSPPPGLNFCPNPPATSAGFATAEDAQAADGVTGTECVQDPRLGSIIVNSPDEGAPDSGSSTVDAFKSETVTENGWKVAIEAGAPSSPGGHAFDAVRARVEAQQPYGLAEETGWYWCPCNGGGSNGYVVPYTQAEGGNIYIHPIFHLQQGNFYPFRIRGYSSNGALFEFRTLDYVWHVLGINNNVGCANADCQSNGIGTRVHCVDSSNCPNLSAPSQHNPGIDFMYMQYKHNTDWFNWSDSTLNGGVGSYGVSNQLILCLTSFDWWIWTPKANTCYGI
jgi:hypothetical protein